MDHVFPWVLRQRGDMPDAEGVWSLTLACRACNRGRGDEGMRAPSGRLTALLRERNSFLVDRHHPLREAIVMQTGASTPPCPDRPRTPKDR